MKTRLVVLASVPLTGLALVTGCTPAASSASPAPASASTARASASTAAERTASAAPAAEPTSDGGDGGMLAGLGTDADWKKLVTPCPHDGQKPVVQKVVTADVTGDGTYDALVARSCEARTSYYPSTVEVFDGASQSTHPRRLATLLREAGPTDQPWLTTLRVTGRQVVIEANGTDSRDDNACPSVSFTYRYRYSGAGFQRVSRDAGNANECLPVG